MIYPEEEVSKHLMDNSNDFIFNDSYLEDSWGLHSDLLLSTYVRQMNAFLSTIGVSYSFDLRVFVVEGTL